MIRLTIIDPDQAVSLLTDEEKILSFVAGCSINPATIGELLLAAETYNPGITAKVMSELMEFDKTVRQKGPDFIGEAITSAQARGELLEMTFQVVDERTETEALVPRDGELVVLDLAQHIVFVSETFDIPLSGEIHIHSGQTKTDKTVTFILPQSWKRKPIVE